jgi:hypothetical protein
MPVNVLLVFHSYFCSEWAGRVLGKGTRVYEGFIVRVKGDFLYSKMGVAP